MLDIEGQSDRGLAYQLNAGRRDGLNFRPMNIFVDESGTFGGAPNPDSWCVVAAYLSPEIDRDRLMKLVRSLRRECAGGDEIKLGDLTEARYSKFLRDLTMLNGAAFAVGIDASLHSEADLIRHRDAQAERVAVNVDRMLHASGRRAVADLAAAIAVLPIQLYAQLVCQTELFYDVLATGITYYAQRFPPTLARFRWMVDRKDTNPTAYEQAFRKILPALLQTKSVTEPMLMLIGANYSYFKRFEFAEGKGPTHLRDYYGLEIEKNQLNVGKLVGEDFQLVDSAAVPGVQVADLLASGLRRAMRGNFDDPETVASLLGANMVQAAHRRAPLRLLSLGKQRNVQESERTHSVLKAMTRINRQYLV